MKLGELRKLAGKVPELQGPVLQQWLLEQISEMGMDPNAIYQELEMTSPLVDTHRDVSDSNAHMSLHSHAFYELIYCRNSCGAEYLVGSERYRLQAGDIIFVPPGVSHRPLLPEDMAEPYKRYVLWLSGEFMELFFKLFSYSPSEKLTRSGLLRTGGTAWEQLGELFRAGVQEAERQQDGWEAAVIGNTLQLLIRIKRATDARSVWLMEAEKPELLDRLTAYVEAHYMERITIGELSRHFYVSSSTVSHLFQQKLGVSFYRFVTQRRLIAAKALILDGNMLETVSGRVGFSDYSAFYRAFRQEYGISPRQYRSLQDTGSKNLR